MDTKAHKNHDIDTSENSEETLCSCNKSRNYLLDVYQKEAVCKLFLKKVWCIRIGFTES